MKLLLETPEEEKALRTHKITSTDLTDVIKKCNLEPCIDILVIDDMDRSD